MTAKMIDSGVDSVYDLHALLPEDVRERLTPEMLREAPTAGALRVLATIRDPRWRQHVQGEQHGPEAWVRIEWDALLGWARGHLEPSGSVLVRLEIAASLAGHLDSNPQLLYAARKLDRDNLAAVADALRIASEGLEVAW